MRRLARIAGILSNDPHDGLGEGIDLWIRVPPRIDQRCSVELP